MELRIMTGPVLLKHPIRTALPFTVATVESPGVDGGLDCGILATGTLLGALVVFPLVGASLWATSASCH